MKKINSLYIDEKDGVNFIVAKTEDGTLYKQEDIATGNCWMLYWVEQTDKEKVKELSDLILKVNQEGISRINSAAQELKNNK